MRRSSGGLPRRRWRAVVMVLGLAVGATRFVAPAEARPLAWAEAVTASPWQALWGWVESWLGSFEKEGGAMDPNGLASPAPPPVLDQAGGGMDPHG